MAQPAAILPPRHRLAQVALHVARQKLIATAGQGRLMAGQFLNQLPRYSHDPFDGLFLTHLGQALAPADQFPSQYLHCLVVQPAQVHVLKFRIGPLLQFQQSPGKMLKRTRRETLQTRLTGSQRLAQKLPPRLCLQIRTVLIQQARQNLLYLIRLTMSAQPGISAQPASPYIFRQIFQTGPKAPRQFPRQPFRRSRQTGIIISPFPAQTSRLQSRQYPYHLSHKWRNIQGLTFLIRRRV